MESTVESTVVNEVMKRPIVYDKRLRTDVNYKEKLLDAFEEIAAVVYEKINLAIPAQGIQNLWLKCVANYKRYKNSSDFTQQGGSRSSKTLSSPQQPHYLQVLDRISEHFDHRQQITSEIHLKQRNRKSAAAIDEFIGLTKSSKCDAFAIPQIKRKRELQKEFSSLKKKCLSHSLEKETSPKSEFFNIIFEKLKKLPTDSVEPCFMDILEELKSENNQ